MNHDPVPDDIHTVIVNQTAWKKVKVVLYSFSNDRVASIVTALGIREGEKLPDIDSKDLLLERGHRLVSLSLRLPTDYRGQLVLCSCLPIPATEIFP
jgi:hypothetical protein